MTHSNIYPFKTRPYAHQSEAWELSREKDEFALFMDMGTGKSKVIIDSIAYLYDKGKIDTALIVAPKGTYQNWTRNELPVHLPDHIQVRTAAWNASPKKEEAKQLESILNVSHDLRVLVMNVEAFSTSKGTKFAESFIRCSGNCMMVVDESTTIKNPKAKRTKAIIKTGIQAKYRRILTGEPVTRSPLDLYAQFQFLNPALLGFSSYFTFRNRYAIMVDMKAGTRSFKKIVGYQRLEELGSQIKPWSYRIKKHECLDLPDKIYQYREIELSPEQKKLYKSLSDLSVAMLEGKVLSVDTVLTQMLRLHQITCGHYTSDDGEITQVPNNRISELMQVLSEAPNKVIIWATYIEDIKGILAALKSEYGDESTVAYYGAVSQDDRNIAIDRFQEDDTCRFFVGNPQTGSMGITLTAADTVVYYSNSYNLEHRLQSEDRAHRIGQKNNVTYVDLICPGTIDQKIVKALRDKKNIAQQVMGDEWREWLR
jgi:SNF2 family DNA or RNA helicase